MTEVSKLEVAQEQLKYFVEYYETLSEKEKFQLGGLFNQLTGGKLSPYDSPDVVVVGQIPVLDQDGQAKILGVRRAIAPFIGGLALPGGFLEKDEDPVAGVIREIFEETGFRLSPEHMKVVSLPKMGHKNHTLVFLTTDQMIPYHEFEKARDSLHNNAETQELVLLDHDSTLCFPLHQEALEYALAEF